jgi:RimJ/RimL family protein N-acetyltransferase
MILPILRGSRVTLRPPLDEDIVTIVALGSDPEIHRLYGGSGTPEPITLASAAEAVARFHAHGMTWAMEVEGHYIGHIRLDDTQNADRRARLAIGIADTARLSQGYGSEAIALLLEHAFTTLGLHRVGLRVLAFNTRAIRAYEKGGFRVEGRERESALIDGAWHDDLIMGILSHEFGPSALADQSK